MANVIPAGEGRKQTVLGDHQTVKISARETNGAFAIVEQNNPAGVAVPMHYHTREDETFYVVEGEMEITLENKKIVATVGTTVHIARQVKHAIKFTGTNTNKTIIMLVPAGAEEMFLELSHLPSGPPDLPSVKAICEKYGVYMV